MSEEKQKRISPVDLKEIDREKAQSAVEKATWVQHLRDEFKKLDLTKIRQVAKGNDVVRYGDERLTPTHFNTEFVSDKTKKFFITYLTEEPGSNNDSDMLANLLQAKNESVEGLQAKLLETAKQSLDKTYEQAVTIAEISKDRKRALRSKVDEMSSSLADDIYSQLTQDSNEEIIGKNETRQEAPEWFKKMVQAIINGNPSLKGELLIAIFRASLESEFTAPIEFKLKSANLDAFLHELEKKLVGSNERFSAVKRFSSMIGNIFKGRANETQQLLSAVERQIRQKDNLNRGFGVTNIRVGELKKLLDAWMFDKNFKANYVFTTFEDYFKEVKTLLAQPFKPSEINDSLQERTILAENIVTKTNSALRGSGLSDESLLGKQIIQALVMQDDEKQKNLLEVIESAKKDISSQEEFDLRDLFEKAFRIIRKKAPQTFAEIENAIKAVKQGETQQVLTSLRSNLDTVLGEQARNTGKIKLTEALAHLSSPKHDRFYDDEDDEFNDDDERVESETDNLT